jgi:hypothetical protein
MSMVRKDKIEYSFSVGDIVAFASLKKKTAGIVVKRWIESEREYPHNLIDRYSVNWFDNSGERGTGLPLGVIDGYSFFQLKRKSDCVD